MSDLITGQPNHSERFFVSVDHLKSVLDWTAVVLAGLTFVVGGLALRAGNIIADRQAEQLRQFNIDLEKQKGQTAIAQAEVLRLQEQRLPRRLKFNDNGDLQSIIVSLKNEPLPTIILFKKGDSEAQLFAQEVWGLLLSAGWKVPAPITVPDEMASNVLERLNSQPQGVTLVVKKISENDDPHETVNILKNLFVRSLGEVFVGADPAMHENSLRIVILQKP